MPLLTYRLEIKKNGKWKTLRESASRVFLLEEKQKALQEEREVTKARIIQVCVKRGVLRQIKARSSNGPKPATKRISLSRQQALVCSSRP
ncbi:MAG: hypothetical protein AAB358_03985 [Patescibacteria group bacterium]